ncbi:hypothetical protein FJZ33_00775 [Candidatus Poribacteria bacterium]|nr:hypothetical protein [Candidatus Poribacteria bacterium]
MKKTNLLLLICSLILFVIIIFSLFPQSTKPYPGDTGVAFDDINPLWGPDDETLAFERIHKGRTIKYEIYMFKPFSSGKNITALVEHRDLKKNIQDDIWGSSSQNISEYSNYNSFLQWIRIDNIYEYAYIKTSDLYVGKLLDGIQESLFVSSKNSINSYPDYSSKNNMIVFAFGSKGRTNIFAKEYNRENPSKGSSEVQLTYTESLDTMPRWSPDGKHIVYASRTNGNMDIYIIFNALTNNREYKQLTKDTREETVPTWSPDGNLIAFYSLRDDKEDTLDKENNNPGKEIDPYKRKIFDLCIVDVIKGHESLRIAARDVFRQERRGPVWVNFSNNSNKFDRYILYITGNYDEIRAVSIEKLLNSECDYPEVIHIKGRQEKVLLGHIYGNITGLDCPPGSFEHAGDNCIYLAYSALSENHQKRIYWALLYSDFTFDSQTEDQP